MNGIDEYKKQVSFYQNRILVIIIGVGLFTVILAILASREYSRRHQTTIDLEATELKQTQFKEVRDKINDRQQGDNIAPLTIEGNIGKPEPFGSPF